MSAQPKNEGAADVQERTMKTGEVRVERKLFSFELKENRRGRFLQITETDGGRHKIMIPAKGLQEFAWMIEALLRPET